MRLLNVRGKLVNRNVQKYLVNWNKKSRSILQYRVKQFLKPFWRGHIVYEEFPVYGSLLKVDILNATFKIAVEVQGPQHNKLHYFHGGEPFNFLESIKRDCTKLRWVERNGFKFVEIMHDEVDLLSVKFFLDKFQVIL